MQGNKIYIVDPVFRGSRMFISFLLIKKLVDEGRDFEILTRTHYKNDQFTEFFGNMLDSEHVNEFFDISADAWYFKVPLKSVIKLVKHMLKHGKSSTYYFTGINEWFPKLNIIFLFLALFLNLKKRMKLVAIDYDPRAIEDRSSTQGKIKSFLRKRLIKSTGITFGIMDESIDLSKEPAYFFLPDPPNAFIPAAPKATFDNQSISILIVGLQTRRKGLYELYDFIENNRDSIPKGIRFRLVGRFSEETEALKGKLSEDPLFEVREGFLTETDILQEYVDASFVIIPYTRSFNSTSGVLAYSMYAGTPVISTDHGLIAYRIRQFGLGYTYNIDEYSQLAGVLDTIQQLSSGDYNQLVSDCRIFSENNSVQTHQNVLMQYVN